MMSVNSLSVDPNLPLLADSQSPLAVLHMDSTTQHSESDSETRRLEVVTTMQTPRVMQLT
jgi:hypothetical protein